MKTIFTKNFVLSIGLLLMASISTLGQTTGDYRTSNSSTNWNNASPSTWQTWNGSNWVNTSTQPGATNRVFIQSGHTVTLSAAASCLDIYISRGTASNSGSTGTLALTSNVLSINGKLSCYYGGVNTSNNSNNALSINPSTSVQSSPITKSSNSNTGRIKFVGSTRNIVETSQWGAGNSGATTTFDIEIAMTAGETATMQTSIKAYNWYITSGTLSAGTNRVSCDNGNTGEGNFTISSAASFISSATGTGSSNQIISRTGGSKMGTLTVNAGGTIKLLGAVPTIDANTFAINGTVEYGSASNQSFIAPGNGNGSALTSYSNISISGGNGTKTMAISGGISVTGTLTVGTGTTLSLTTDITLKSTATQTAQVAAVAGTISYGTGKFIIERYIQARRAWRFLAAPVTAASAPSINAAWQEGVTTASVNANPNPGYGTHITGGNNTGLGFDQNPSGSFSTKQSTVSNVWDNISNTATAKVTDQKGYMVFVRGSRANVLSQGTGAVADATTLRVSGQLNVGDQTFTNSAAGYFPVSNPYASAINLPTVWGTGNNITMTYSVWDPFLTGSNSVGAFVQYSWNGFSWTKSVTPVSALVDGKVESGSAIIVQWMGANTLTLTESNKTSGSVLSQTPTTAPTEESRITLNRVNGDGTVSTQDGMVVTYDAAYSNGLDMWDAEKLNNFSQNISSNRNGSKIAIERRALIANHDTTFINMDQIGAGNYQFEIANTELNHPGLIGQLKDNYLNTLTNLDLNGTTTIAFTIDGNAASYAVNRFAIYFGIAAPLPVNYSSVKAYRRSNDIAVEWKVENEISIKQYQVERAADGTNFSKIATVLPTGNANSSAQYLAADISPLSGDNFYRVKAISLSGRIQYSPVVRVVAPKTTQEISVYPNPVTSNTINIRYSQQTAGTYQARLYTIDGILIYNGSIQLSSNGVEAIILGAKPAAGSYQLEIKNANETILTQKVIVQ